MARVALSDRRATVQWTAEVWSAAGTAAAGPTAAACATTPTTPGLTAPTAAPRRHLPTRAACATAAASCAAAPRAAGASWRHTHPAAAACPASRGWRAPRTTASQAMPRPPPPPRACLRGRGVPPPPLCRAVATGAAGPWEEGRTAGTANAREASWGQVSANPLPYHHALPTTGLHPTRHSFPPALLPPFSPSRPSSSPVTLEPNPHSDCGEGDTTSCPRSCSGHGDCSLQPVAAPPLSLAKQIAITAARLAAVDAGVKANATALASLLGPASMAPRCTCHRGWEGVDCSASQRCPELHAVRDYGPSADPATCQPHTPCCGHGLCVLGECKCEAGYHDATCARYEGVAP